VTGTRRSATKRTASAEHEEASPRGRQRDPPHRRRDASREAREGVAFAPDRSKESIGAQICINLFARDVHFAKSGEVKLSKLRDGIGVDRTPSSPVRGVRPLDVSVSAEMDGSPSMRGECLALTISGE